MKTTLQSRLARFAGMLLLSSIVFAVGVQAAQANLATEGGSGSGSGVTGTLVAQAGTQGRGGVSLAPAAASAATSASSASSGSVASASTQGLTAAQRHHFFGPPQSVIAVSAAAGTQGRGGVALAQGTPTGGQLSASATSSRHTIAHFQPTANVLATQTGSSPASSTSAWIAAGLAAGIFLIGLAAWSLTRRRGQSARRPSDEYCTLHPDDALCSAA
jgi:hypothetical protein